MVAVLSVFQSDACDCCNKLAVDLLPRTALATHNRHSNQGNLRLLVWNVFGFLFNRPYFLRKQCNDSNRSLAYPFHVACNVDDGSVWFFYGLFDCTYCAPCACTHCRPFAKARRRTRSRADSCRARHTAVKRICVQIIKTGTLQKRGASFFVF